MEEWAEARELRGWEGKLSEVHIELLSFIEISVIILNIFIYNIIVIQPILKAVLSNTFHGENSVMHRNRHLFLSFIAFTKQFVLE